MDADLVPLSQLNLFKYLRWAACLAACLIVAGCATRKAPKPPPLTFPPTQEAVLQELRTLPQGPYDRVAVITVAAEVGDQLVSAIKSARQSAAQKGATALVIVQEKEFLQKVGKRTLRVRRITYLAIHGR